MNNTSYLDARPAFALSLNTDEFLAIRFPHLVKHKKWLQQVNNELGEIERKNGLNTELRSRFQGGKHAWTEWVTRILGNN